MYTVLQHILKQKRGLEFEREYSAVHEVYRYVCIRVVHDTNCPCTQCTCIRGLELVWKVCGQRCRIRH
jgi:hypothetical protein